MRQVPNGFFDGCSRRDAGDALSLDLVGPLSLTDAEGTNLTPRARKAQGLLALVGTSPGLRRSRAWLQDKLWSDRGPVQGASSLRQCLTEIRSTLGRHIGCLKTDRELGRSRSGARSCERRPQPAGFGDVEFLEGLDIRDPEFEHWIRDQRMLYSERYGRRRDYLLAPAGRDLPGHVRPTVGLVSRLTAKGEPEAALADVMLNLVASALLGDPAIDVIDLRHRSELGAAPTPVEGLDWRLCVASSVWRSRVRITLTLSDGVASRLHWTDDKTFDVAEFYVEEPLAVDAFAARVAGFVLARIPGAGVGAGPTDPGASTGLAANVSPISGRPKLPSGAPIAAVN